MTINTLGWAIELLGEQIDLDDLREQLKSPYEPWIEDYQADNGKILYLRSASWDKLTEPNDVIRDARRIIEQLNGEALLIHDDAHQVTLGQVVKFDPAGNRNFYPITGHLHVTEGKDRARFRVVVGGTPKQLQQSQMQRWFEEAETDDTRSELFIHLGRMDNWYDFYKAAELARRLAGGQNLLKATLGTEDWKEWNRIWRTANCYRHAPDPVKSPLPDNPAKLEDSIHFLLKTIRGILEVRV